jgi:signal transduction histidine kinase
MGISFAANSDTEVDIKVKIADCKKLVEEAVVFFKEKPLLRACQSFQNDSKWKKGEIFIFVFERDGICYVDENPYMVWQNFTTQKNTIGSNFIEDMLQQGEKGGWVSYILNFSNKQSYVKTVSKNGKTFIIGAGFYPESDEFICQQLVRDAIRFLKERGAQEAFDRINNPIGFFVRGPIYLWAYDLDANTMAHGADISLVGQNSIDWQDSNGFYRNREMVKIAQTEGKGWLNYLDRGVQKRSYIEKVTDPQTKKSYIIGGGYYPDINEDTVKSFVKRAIAYLKSNPRQVALADFSNKAGGFVKGPLTIFVYDVDGVVLADAENPGFINQNLRNSKDPEGKFITQRVLDQAKNFGKGWISFIDKKGYKDAYIEKIQIPSGDYIVGSGYWPTSKSRTVQSLVEKAIAFGQSHTIEEALEAFTSNNSDFIRGDVCIFVYDNQGTCLVAGLDKCRVWSNEMEKKDETGASIADKILQTAAAGGGWIDYSMRNARRRMYVKQLEKGKSISEELAVIREGEAMPELSESTYVIAAGYFL